MATDQIEATYKVVTPLFCGGARPMIAAANDAFSTGHSLPDPAAIFD